MNDELDLSCRTQFKKILTNQGMKFVMKSKVTKVENKAGGGHVVHVESVADGSKSTVMHYLLFPHPSVNTKSIT